MIRKVIKKLNILCQNNNFFYLSNDDITWNYLVKDRTHFFDNRMNILTGSFVDFFDFIFQKYSDFNSNQSWLRLMDPENISFNGMQMSALNSILIH